MRPTIMRAPQADTRTVRPQPNEIEARIRRRAVQKQRRDRMDRWILPLAVMVILIGGWQIWGKVRPFDPLFFATPSRIAQGIWYYAHHSLWTDVKVSGKEWLIGLVISFSAIPIGMVVGRNKRVAYAFDPLIDALYATPHIALAPLFVIWFGLGITSKVVMVASSAFFPLLISAIQGVSTVDGSLLRAAASMGAKKWQAYLDVILPAILPFILAGLRLAIRSALLGVVLGEFIGAVSGVGYQIRAFAENFQTADYLGGVIILVAFSVILNFGVKALERKLAPWRTDQ